MSVWTEFTVDARTLVQDQISVVEIVRGSVKYSVGEEYVIEGVVSTIQSHICHTHFKVRICAASIHAIDVLQKVYNDLKQHQVKFEVHVHRLELY